MPVPETPPHVYDLSTTLHHNIRLARQRCDMEPVADTQSPKKSADHKFRLCVSPGDPPHHAAAPLFGNNVHHVVERCPPKAADVICLLERIVLPQKAALSL
jgi:hypothetical protein